ncbi:molybdopterin-guanine dinucleotide biosynthesis protein A [Kiloniella sp. b19]|uniref:molybdopterin-guanine dinucleotide biosynthesis protein A n=1 Tax=Kiloniella sp. GXU_MW_B19 TaxID=3141326 RepID=UPI0031DEE1F1
MAVREKAFGMLVLMALSLVFLVFGTPAHSSDLSPTLVKVEKLGHSGYYYPEAKTIEIYKARTGSHPAANRKSRLAFVSSVAQANSENAYPPQAAMFAKGADGQKLIIIGLVDGRFDTLFRMRAILANMTSLIRTLPVVQELGAEEIFTFLDLMKLMGFEQVTISNGRELTHQIILE